MRLRLLLIVLLLLGCSDPPPKPRANRAERQQAAADKVAVTPPMRTYRYTDGELRVIEPLATDSTGFVERQRCVIWRDDVFKTTSVSCTAPEPVMVRD